MSNKEKVLSFIGIILLCILLIASGIGFYTVIREGFRQEQVEAKAIAERNAIEIKQLYTAWLKLEGSNPEITQKEFELLYIEIDIWGNVILKDIAIKR